ncbi:hypothetical protein EVAR_47481_1 [Eumeta japonica]|uniref:Uncharacterized protein n=1 Tax=Eumeta variegata TaxID=151549 RepID=A0A4C1XC16_EUMVA|nr:hypothetical protein EVAR_47481_1 [Eumeta japonica]
MKKHDSLSRSARAVRTTESAKRAIERDHRPKLSASKMHATRSCGVGFSAMDFISEHSANMWPARRRSPPAPAPPPAARRRAP